MEPVTKQTFDALLRYRAWPCVSVYLPTHAGGFEGQAGRVRLKNLLVDAEERLVARGIRPVEARDFLASANKLVENEAFWKDQTEGLAVFASPKEIRSFYLPTTVNEISVVNSRFHIAPLVPLIEEETDHYILAVSENRVRLLKANRWQAREVTVPDLPANAREALHYDHPSDTRQFHTALLGRGTSKLGAYHGSGDFFEQEKSELLEYFRVVDRAIRPVLRSERVPLVFVGVDYLFPIFQQANSYPHLSESHVHGNPDIWTDRELHEKALERIAPQFASPRYEALARYSNLAGDGWRSDDLQVILRAAHQGQVDTLLVDVERPVWGNWDENQRRLRLDDPRRDDSDDMVDLAVVQALTHKGSVYSVPGTALWPGKHCQAIFRYELPGSAR
ncbi:MAG TPA: hypothetical protein VG826_35810 [Pirellulales bacterium]|nr:hypothetical protein [Pirellulales bacterium]